MGKADVAAVQCLSKYDTGPAIAEPPIDQPQFILLANNPVLSQSEFVEYLEQLI
jgi:hypothetical protein